MNAFALSVLTPCSRFPLSRFTVCFVSCFLVWKRKLIFQITCREFTYFHILEIRISFVVQDFWRSVYIKGDQTSFQRWKRSSGKHILHLLPFQSQQRQNQKNDLCVQRRLKSGWASAQYDQSLHCPHRTPVFLAIHWAHSEQIKIKNEFLLEQWKHS